MKRMALAVVGALVAGTALAAPAAHAAGQSVPTRGGVGLTWTDCSAEQQIDNLQCTTLSVPLDAANPSGQQITLKLSRIQHTSSNYQGVILMNPGGPGGGGLWLPVLANYLPGTTAADYDWIGWDPRGVGESSPAMDCKYQYFPFNRPNYVPKTKRIMKWWRQKAAAYAASCAANAPAGLLDHVKTTDNVADMESIRQALGVNQINYYGFSYGTYIGQVYATLHPDRVRRMVLDGVVDPTKVWYQANLDQDVAFDGAFNVFWQWIAKHPKTFHLGKNWRKIRADYYVVARRLSRHAWHGKLGPDEFNDAMLSAGYNVYYWPSLGAAFSKIYRTGNGKALLDDFASGDHADGNGFSIYSGTQCTDVQWPTSWSTWTRDTSKIYRKHPFLAWGNLWYNAPCKTWGASAGTPVTVDGTGLSNLNTKILLVSETKDAATPYAGAKAARGLFPSASLIAGMGGTTHAASLSGVSCVDDTIAQYFSDGTVPARLAGNGPDLKCPKLAPPPASGNRVAGSAKVLPWKYRQLLSSAH